MKVLLMPMAAVVSMCMFSTLVAQNQTLPPFLRQLELSEDQEKKVRDLATQFRSQLRGLQEQQNAILTADQRLARREAQQRARDQKLSVNRTRALVDEAVKLTPDQQAQLDVISDQRNQLQQKLQSDCLAILTPAQRNQISQRNRNASAKRIPPTHANVAYGPHERNVLDVWLASSERPTPVVFSIHGGGFRGGNKGVDPGLLKACLDQGWSVVAITYRLSGTDIAPAQFHDAGRAVQFIRSKATEWKLDKSRMASTGGSAGAGLSLWLAFHDDLANPDAADPVLRESTRLRCAVVYNGQSTYDPRVIRKLIPEANTFQHAALPQLYGVDYSDLSSVPQDKLRLFEECSPITHLSADDVPVLLAYATDHDTKITNQGIGIHHPRFGSFLKERMDGLGIECRVETSIRRGSDAWVKQTISFLKDHL